MSRSWVRFIALCGLCSGLTWVCSAALGADESPEPNPPPRKPAENPAIRRAPDRLEVDAGFSHALDGRAGRWRAYRTQRFDSSLSKEQRDQIRQLEAIGYLSGSQQGPADRGVVVHSTGRAQRGLNFYTSGHAPEALLTDMDGRVLHRWSFDFWQVWPDYPIEPDHLMTEFWRRTHLYPNGDILAIHEGLGIIKLDRDSNLLWAIPNRAHHDLAALRNGDIWLLIREARIIARVDPDAPSLDDFVILLDAEGNEKQRHSLIAAFEGTAYEELLFEEELEAGDIFHTNTVHVLEGHAADTHPAFRAGNLQIYLQGVGIEAVLDPNTGKVVWARRNRPRYRHDAQILKNGNLLIFENATAKGRRKSRVVEYRRLSRVALWSFAGSPQNPLSSKTCGTAQRLANGNTLITESDGGRAMEVTPNGEVVWEFVNPNRAGPDDSFIATLFEVVRLPADFPIDWATDAPKNSELGIGETKPL